MIIGSSEEWRTSFIDINDKVTEIVSEVWPACAGRFNSTSLENQITDQLALALQRDPRSRENWLVIPQYKLLTPDAFNGDVVTKGFIDIAIFFTKDQQLYLAYECKRLNVNFPSGFKSLADEYVNEGVMRYVSAQYAEELPVGTMVGFVLDNNVSNAHSSVVQQINGKTTQLRCSENPPIKDLPPVSYITRFSTNHLRTIGTIMVHHMLLPLRNA